VTDQNAIDGWQLIGSEGECVAVGAGIGLSFRSIGGQQWITLQQLLHRCRHGADSTELRVARIGFAITEAVLWANVPTFFILA